MELAATTMPQLLQKTCCLVGMLVCIARFCLVCRPSTDRTVVVVPVEPSHNALLVEGVAARQATQHGLILVTLQADGALHHCYDSGRHLVIRISTLCRFLLLLLVVFSGHLCPCRLRSILLWISVCCRFLMAAVSGALLPTHALVVSVHEILRTGRFRSHPLFFQLLLGLCVSVVILQHATLLADEHKRLWTELTWL